MIKKILLFVLLIVCNRISFGQVFESEKIDWENLPAFSTQSFVFKSDQLTYECKDCRYVELKSNSGVSGYFLLGQAAFSVPKKNKAGNSTAFMIRLNPKDSLKFLQVTNPSKISDEGFVAFSLLTLNSIFTRCYHSGMNALIPNKGEYTADIFSDKDGDMLVAYGDGEVQIFNVSKRKKK